MMSHVKKQNNRILALLEERKLTDVSFTPNLPVEIPLKTEFDLQELEAHLNVDCNDVALIQAIERSGKLKEVEIFQPLRRLKSEIQCSYFTTLGGHDAKSRTNLVMKKLLTDKLASVYNFLGSKGKKAFADTLLIKIVVPTFKEAQYYGQRFAKADDENTAGNSKRKRKPNMKYRDSSVLPPPSLSLNPEHSTDRSLIDEATVHASEILAVDELAKSNQANRPRNVSIKTEPQKDRTFESIINEAPIIIENSLPDQVEVMNNILESILNVNGRLDIIENRLHNIEKVLNTSFSVNPQRSRNEMSELLPLKSIQKLQELEDKLEEDNNKQQLLQVLQYIGGSNEKTCVGRCLERLLTNHCAMFCSWTGKKDNFKIKNLKCIQVLKDAVRNEFPSIKDDVFERNVMAWLQFAKTRYDRGKE